MITLAGAAVVVPLAVWAGLQLTKHRAALATAKMSPEVNSALTPALSPRRGGTNEHVPVVPSPSPPAAGERDGVRGPSSAIPRSTEPERAPVELSSLEVAQCMRQSLDPL